MIKFRLGQFFNRHKAAETIGDVTVRLLFLQVLGVFVVFFGNVQREVQEWIVLLALLSTH